MNREIVTRIRRVIDHYGLSVSAFSDTIGVQRSSISHLLNGRNKPSLDFVMKLVDSYPEVSLYWLLQGKGEFPAEEVSGIRSEDVEKSPVLDIGNISEAPEALKELPNSSKPRPEATNNEPEKIVFFYSDGTFAIFKSKND